MKFLIVGLGNPGAQYMFNRHNIGFKILDNIAKNSNSDFTTDKYADYCKVMYKGKRLIMIKPNTFMNLSGKAVNYWLQKSKLTISNLLVITDDISLPFGQLRMRQKGSSGGHNGLKDIEQNLKQNTYPRLRFGVGSNFLKGQQANYVLSNFSKEEQEVLEKKIDQAIEMIKSFTTSGIELTMSNYNNKFN